MNTFVYHEQQGQAGSFCRVLRDSHSMADAAGVWATGEGVIEL